jgi:LEA14-like dessication related protein
MKIKNIVYIVIIVLIIYYFRLGSAARNFRYGIGSVKNFSLKGGGISWTQGIVIVNGDIVSVPIRSLNVVNYVGNTEVGTSILDDQFTIAGNGASEMPVKIFLPYISLLGIGQELQNTLRSGNFRLRFKGSISTIGVNIPIDQTFPVLIPKFNTI